jgi:hypothetical protein
MICPACQGDVPAGARFCPSCGSPAAIPPPEAADPLRAALESSLGFQYRIDRPLGRGGMGAVYLARELALDRDVAIKVLPPDRSHGTNALERFRREARTAARLSHPNIVPLHTFGEVKGLVYFVMGYVRGESLAPRLRHGVRVDADTTRRILVEVADALAYAHAQGVVHRDIKPDNILIDADSGRPMLTDFGLAKARSLEGSLTETGLVVGTPHYMSPEQAAGRPDIDGRSDLYSLGVMGYAMLAGRLPFDGKTPGDVLVQHLTKEPPPLQAVAPGTPYRLSAALMRCLAKDPSARWPDAKALKEALTPDESVPELPAKVRAVGVLFQGLLGLLLLRVYVWLYLACDPDQTSAPAFLREPAEKVTFLVGAAAAFTAIQARRRLALPWPAIVRPAFLQPAWWPGWYPRALRRPEDLWERLPPQVRAARHVVAITIVVWVLLLAPLLVMLTAAGSLYERTGMRTEIGSLALAQSQLVLWIALLTLAAVVGDVLATLWLRRRLGDEYEYDFDEMPVVGATWKQGSPWRRPAYQALLRPFDADAVATPRSEDELEAAIRCRADAMPSGLVDVALAVRTAVRSIRASIAALDQETAALARDTDPLEAARLEGKLSALGPPSPEDPPDRRKMRDLLARQLSLIQDLLARLEAARRDRAGHVEMLRSLWRRLASLADEPAWDSASSSRAVEQLRALCAEIERRTVRSRPTVETRHESIDELPTLER